MTLPRRLTKPIKRLLNSVLLGCAATVLIAYSIALLRSPPKSFGPSQVIGFIPQIGPAAPGSSAGFILAASDAHLFGERVVSVMSARSGRKPGTISPMPAVPADVRAFLNREWATSPLDESELAMNAMQVVRMFGWPFPCVYYGYVTNQPAGTGASWSGSIYSGLRIDSTNPSSRVLPMRVLWSAFAANALILSAAFCLGLTCLTMFHTSHRRRRHACPDCGYDLHASRAGDPCPECGNHR